MKRLAAITGHTPAMIRWTLARNCELRDLSAANLAESTARQLQGLREYSRAIAENRCFSGYCFHHSCDASADPPTVSNTNVEAMWMAFPSDEPFSVFGERNRVIATCLDCPANVAGPEQGIAGCWGAMPFHTIEQENRRCPEIRLATGESIPIADLCNWFECELADSGMKRTFDAVFPVRFPRWMSLWAVSTRPWNHQQIEWCEHFFRFCFERIPVFTLREFATAIQVAWRDQLPVRFEFVPPGYSDGNRWVMADCCHVCSWPADTAEKERCDCCGGRGTVRKGKTRKVLGMRPWLRLVSMVGEEEARRLVGEFRDRPR